MGSEFIDMTLEDQSAKLKAFAIERDWEQFQSPKNLSMALIVEAAELVEHFQWLTQQQSVDVSLDKDSQKYREIALEMADILAYLLLIAEKMDVDLLASLKEKIEINEQRYPADKVRGSAKKYSEFQKENNRES
ncbi:MAG TPA: nucleotide pyrophosphohydrolase [Gammaproteobacteria bacterium]|jgi:NTP pyrophosphatase (non-canonical NTP hydrolase)|nr:nucleotide pyrophosphohydrolase [Gammaproteobacteria bacterium]